MGPRAVAKRLGALAALAALLTSGRDAGADPAAHAVPAVRILGDREGLPQSTVAAEAFDARGRLWVGTQEGLAVYEGRGFQRVLLPHETLAWITALTVMPDDTVVVGTHDDGVWLLREGRFEHASAPAALPDGRVRAVLAGPGPDGTPALWVGTRAGLAVRTRGTWSTVDFHAALLGDDVSALALGPPDARGTPSLWIGTAAGLASLRGDALRAYRGGDAGLPRSKIARLLVEATEGETPRVFASTDAGLAVLEGERFRLLTSADGLPCDDVGPVARVGRSLWVGTLCGGLARLDDGRVSLTVDAKSGGLPSDLVRSLLVGLPTQGPPSLWLGTETGGVARVALGGFRALTEPGTPGRAAVYAFGWSHDRTGPRSWIGTESGLFGHDGRRWAPEAIPGLDAADAYVNAILDGSTGSDHEGLWVGTFGGIARLREGAWKVFAPGDGLPGPIALTLAEVTTAPGRTELLAGFRPGLARLRGERWETVDEPGGPAREEITSMTETDGPSGAKVLWVATAGAGLFRREAGQWTHLTAATSPLPSDDVLQVARVALFGGQRLVVSTGEVGLAWLDPTSASPSWFRLTSETQPALPDPVVYGVQQDRQGRLYAFTNHGVARLRARDDGTESFDLGVLTTDDGLPSSECNSGASGVDPQGRIWVGTVAGAAVLEPDDQPDDHVAKELLLDETRVLDRPFDLRATPQLRYDQDTVAFELSLVSFHRPGDTRYRTQLVGLEREPSGWTPDPRVRFAGLRAGGYELRAWGRDYAGNVSGPLVVPFRVRPAPWSTWWAWATYAALGVGLVASVFRLRVAALQARARELEGHAAARTSELAAKVRELDRKNLELLESHRRADRIFSALADVLPGSVLDDKYRIGRKLGAGGFGTVFQAHQLSLDREVAVKIFRPKPGNDSAAALERFRREGMSACRVNHPNAIQVYDSGLSSDGIPYLVMELLEGQTLSSLLRAQGALSLLRAIDIAVPIAEALAAAHEAGLIHRDVKPDNVFLQRTKDGVIVKLLDFGVAKLLEDSGEGPTGDEGTHALVGTPRYMAPERLTRGRYDASSDVYAAGIVLYEVIAGRLPWPKTVDLFVLVARMMAGVPVSMQKLGVPEPVAGLVMRTLSTEPGERPTARELADGLRDAEASLTLEQLETVYGEPAETPEGEETIEGRPSPGEKTE